MNFTMMLECVYEDGTVLFTYSPKYMRTAKGRPVRVTVHGEATVSDYHAIGNAAARGAQLICLNPVEGGSV